MTQFQKSSPALSQAASLSRFARKQQGPLLSLLSLGLLGALTFGFASQSHAQASPTAQGAAKPAEAVTMKPMSDEMLTVQGTVAYRQRMAMPPNAVLQVQVADVSLMDAPAKVLAESREEFGGRQVPLRFNLKVPKSAIDERHRYAVSARIMIGDRLAFISTEHNGVLTQGQGNQVDLLLQAVGSAPTAAKPESAGKGAGAGVGTGVSGGAAATLAPTLPPFALPASFAGVLPCADCAGVAQTLTLRPDGLYRLRSVYLGKSGAPLSEQGRWMAEAGGQKLVLQSASGRQMWALSPASKTAKAKTLVKDGPAAEPTLRLLDQQGKPIVSKLNYELRRTAKVDEISEPLKWQGEFVYMADAARFTDCVSGLSWPVTMAGDFANLQRSYGQFAKAPGAPVLVKLEGRLLNTAGMDNKQGEHLQVDKFLAAEASGARCANLTSQPAQAAAQGAASEKGKAAAGASKASLTGTYWKLVELNGKKPASPADQVREVQITLHKENHRVSGSSGCNRMMGSFKQTGAAGLSFSRMAGTMMACSPEAMAMEQKVHALLAETTGFSIEGEQLSLLAGNRVLARFESVYLR
ncbi:YbaY family lipoprotein [Paucibacter sp. KBW04]|uniref:YbaY family lipoprotein n=1 Tax=Paucibacter sp. KBW04 TaxID=2153361 RepID=UPI0018CC08A5|nr:YbaY family lipoprotein [Paucibacter sp. KBW04]